MNGYKAFFNGKEVDIYADTLFQAKERAKTLLKVPKSKIGLLAVGLCEKDVPMNPDGTPAGPGTQYVHTAVD
jgi:hypothetical protein